MHKIETERIFPMQRLMCRLLVAAIVVVVASAAFAQDNKVALTGFLMDKMCAAKAVKSGNADASAKKHTKECAEACNESGFGLVTGNKFYLFDSKGNELAQAMLKSTRKTDSLGIEVVGTVDGDKIKVDSLKEVE
jgi:hypothetical protein